ncbi:hypothetical protein GCM10022245_34980 [Streptomyces mayteni]
MTRPGRPEAMTDGSVTDTSRPRPAAARQGRGRARPGRKPGQTGRSPGLGPDVSRAPAGSAGWPVAGPAKAGADHRAAGPPGPVSVRWGSSAASRREARTRSGTHSSPKGGRLVRRRRISS